MISIAHIITFARVLEKINIKSVAKSIKNNAILSAIFYYLVINKLISQLLILPYYILQFFPTIYIIP